MSNNDYASIFERAKAYPYVAPEMYQSSSLVRIASGHVSLMSGPIAIQASIFDHQLSGSDKVLPGYDLLLSDGTILRDRLPVVAIGSNSSPDVLIKKFREKAVGGDFAILQGTLHHHVIAHGAFVGAAGTIPATLVPEQDSSAHITVSFLTLEQAEKLTTTEPNYDLVALASEIETRGFNPHIPPGALAYVSPWGALSTDGVHPLILSAIPSQTAHTPLSSEEAMNLVARIITPEVQSAEDWFNALNLAVENRLSMNGILKAHALPAIIAGTQVKAATIGEQAERLGLPKPSIHYLP